MKIRFISMLLALVMVLGMMPMLALGVSAAGFSITEPDNDTFISKSDAPTLKWSRVSGAAGYRVTVYNATAGEDIIRNKWTTSRSLSLSDLVEDVDGYPLLKIWVGAMASKGDDAALTSLEQDIVWVSLAEAPDVTLNAPKNVDEDSASFTLNIVKNYGSAISDAGVYISTTKSIDDADKFPVWGVKSEGSMTVGVGSLESGTKYYCWAYAKNGVGESISFRKSFTTKKAGPAHSPIEDSRETTRVPEETTWIPEETTRAPEETTWIPEETTWIPEETVKEPAETKEAITVTPNKPVIGLNAKRQAVVDRAYAWYNKTWTLTADLTLWHRTNKTGVTVEKGTVVRGIPYTQVSCKYSIDSSLPEKLDYFALSDSKRYSHKENVYCSGVLGYRDAPEFGAECVQLVYDAWYHGDAAIGKRDTKDTWFKIVGDNKNRGIVEEITWGEVLPGDALGKSSHIRLVVEVNDNNTPSIYTDDEFKVIEQTSAYLSQTNIGTTEYTYTYASLVKEGYVPYRYNKLDEVDGDTPYTDVKKSAWYYEDVKYVTERELMNGVSSTRFAPDDTTNRAMLVTVLWRLEGEPSVKNSARFSDVLASAWYADAVNWAYTSGIVDGYGNGKFGPMDSLTREQVVTIMYRYSAYKGDAATLHSADLRAYTYSTWAVSYVFWAHCTGLFDDIGTNINNLKGTASRAELAAYLRRLCK